MRMMKFECLKCGHCCRTLITKVDFGSAGLFLLPNETFLFPKTDVSPLYGIGVKGRSRPRPEKIIAYQFGKMVCPHLSEENLCKIYSTRPITCRSYPLETTLVGNIINSQCTFIRKNFKEGIFFNVDLVKPELKKANLILTKHVMKSMSEFNTILWGFDLETKKWRRWNIEQSVV